MSFLGDFDFLFCQIFRRADMDQSRRRKERDGIPRPKMRVQPEHARSRQSSGRHHPEHSWHGSSRPPPEPSWQGNDRHPPEPSWQGTAKRRSDSLQAWGEWRGQLNEVMIDKAVSGVPVRSRTQGHRSAVEESLRRDPRQYMKYALASNMGTELLPSEFLQYGIPRAKVNMHNEQYRSLFRPTKQQPSHQTEVPPPPPLPPTPPPSNSRENHVTSPYHDLNYQPSPPSSHPAPRDEPDQRPAGWSDVLRDLKQRVPAVGGSSIGSDRPNYQELPPPLPPQPRPSPNTQT